MSNFTQDLGAWMRRAYGEGSPCPPPEVFLPSEWSGRSAEERERLEEHLERCPACAAERDLARTFEPTPEELAARRDEIAPLVRAQTEGSPGAVQPLLAWGVTCLELGDCAGARAVHDAVRRDDYAMLKPPGTWNRLFELAWSAELAEGLGDTTAAALLHQLLVPFDGLHTHSAAFYVGPVAHHLGVLEAHLGRVDEARAHFAATLEFAEDIGARPAASAARSALARLGVS